MKRKPAPAPRPTLADLMAAARALLDKLDTITTEHFACGEERPEREDLRSVLDALEEPPAAP